MLIKQRPIAGHLDHWQHIDPLIARIYAARGIAVSDADLSLKGMADYKHLLHIDSACLRLKQAILQNQKIVVIGDFDADGATASALAVAALKAFAATNVSFWSLIGLTTGMVLVKVLCMRHTVKVLS